MVIEMDENNASAFVLSFVHMLLFKFKMCRFDQEACFT